MHRVRRALMILLASMPPCGVAAAEAPAGKVEIVGQSLDGRLIECQVYGDGPDVFLLIATIHGNEAAGTPLAAKFVEWLAAHPQELEGRRVVVVPVANPDGMADNTRHNKSGVDLNRNFPAANFDAEAKVHGPTPLSEPESRALMRVLCQYFPNRVVTIHQPLSCVDYDGPFKDLAEAMAAKCKLPVKHLGSRPGSLGSFVGLTLARPIITLELPEDAGMDGDVLWKEYGEALIAALRYEHEGDDAAEK